MPRARIPAHARAGILLAALFAPACTSRGPAPLSTPPVVTASDARVRVLQRDLAALLDVPVLRRGLAAVVVRSADRGDTLFRYHDDALVVPASTMKVVTLAAAAERLGWDVTFATAIRAGGPLERGVLHGDLVVVGSGDPAIGTPDEPATVLMDRWAEALWRRGLRHVDGRLVGDDRAFSGAGLGEGWAWDDMAWGYSAPVSALQAHAGAAEVRVMPAPREGEAATVTLWPRESGLTLDAVVTTGPANGVASLSFARAPGGRVLHVTGTVPSGATAIVRTAAAPDPTRYFLALFEAALARRGILVRGPSVGVADLAPSDWPRPDAPVLLEHRSPPLATMATALMKASQNQYAETLLRALGRTEPAAEGTVEAGRVAVQRVLQAWGITPDALVQADGSGLSRYDYVTAGTLATILDRMHREPRHRQPWLDALAVGGVDGTLERRFKGTVASGRLRAKTGSLSNVRALCGYVPAASGESLIFVVVLNHVTATSRELNAVTDGIVLRLAAFGR
jgi:D-alanyl-D-alanine carboxypeptidase/D-alanyl-D-alanine-endopeptidase (penicillin-binding protein 4)